MGASRPCVAALFHVCSIWTPRDRRLAQPVCRRIMCAAMTSDIAPGACTTGRAKDKLLAPRMLSGRRLVSQTCAANSCEGRVVLERLWTKRNCSSECVLDIVSQEARRPQQRTYSLQSAPPSRTSGISHGAWMLCPCTSPQPSCPKVLRRCVANRFPILAHCLGHVVGAR